MAGVPAGLSAGVRVSDHISLGVIVKTFPPDRVPAWCMDWAVVLRRRVT